MGIWARTMRAGAMAGLLACGAGAWAQIPPGIRATPGQPGGPQLAKPSAAIPATAPTVVQPIAPPLPQVPTAPPAAPMHRARVEYRDGLVTVTANNSGLNQILRDIAKATGMKISGGVTDEHVFGTYGPGTLTEVLQPLLNGTGSNMLLVESADQSPEELILTPRQGGASPPNPMAGRDDPDDDLPPQLTPRTSNVNTGVPARAEAPPQPRPFVPPTVDAPVTPAPAAAVTAPAATTTTDQSPNGVKTPQQIYDELMKMQQQQKKTPQ